MEWIGEHYTIMDAMIPTKLNLTLLEGTTCCKSYGSLVCFGPHPFQIAQRYLEHGAQGDALKSIFYNALLWL